MASQQRKERIDRNLSRGCLSATLVLLVLFAAVVGYFEIAQPLLQGDAPAVALRKLCADEMHQDYVAAFGLLSSRFIQQYGLDQDKFVQVQQGRDQQHGPVVACAIVGRDYGMALFNTDASFRVTATLDESGSPYTDTGTIQLVNEGGWKISTEEIDDILYLAG
jgi:hypothetical protein